jgi:hypothetical protein
MQIPVAESNPRLAIFHLTELPVLLRGTCSRSCFNYCFRC